MVVHDEAEGSTDYDGTTMRWRGRGIHQCPLTTQMHAELPIQRVKLNANDHSGGNPVIVDVMMRFRFQLRAFLVASPIVSDHAG